MISNAFDTVRTPQQYRGDRLAEHTLNTQQQFTLTVDGIAEPAHFDSLSEAVHALWSLLATLPLSEEEHETYHWFLNDGGEQRAEDFVVRDGRLTLGFTAGGTRYTAVIEPS